VEVGLFLRISTKYRECMEVTVTHYWIYLHVPQFRKISRELFFAKKAKICEVTKIYPAKIDPIKVYKIAIFSCACNAICWIARAWNCTV